MSGELEGAVEQGLVLDDAGRLDPARRGHDHLRRGVVDPDRELVGREASEDDRVHRTDACTGQHRDDCLGDHRQVDHDPVAGLDPQTEEPTGESRSLAIRDQLARRARIAGSWSGSHRPAYVGGRGWLGVRLDRSPDWAEVGEIVEDAYRTVASPKFLKLLDAG